MFGRGREIQGRTRASWSRRARACSTCDRQRSTRAATCPAPINVPVQELDRRLAEVGPRDGELVLYCRSGHRSARATEILRRHGFTKVHNLGPMTAW